MTETLRPKFHDKVETRFLAKEQSHHLNNNNNSNKKNNSMSTTEYIESYKQQLQLLDSLLSPKKLFKEIDSIFRPYQTLKREYSTEWSKYEMFHQKLQSFLHSNNPPNQSIIASINEIQGFIEKMQCIQASLNEWLQNLLNPQPISPLPTIYQTKSKSNTKRKSRSRSRPRSKKRSSSPGIARKLCSKPMSKSNTINSKKQKPRIPPLKCDVNLRPSHARKLSFSQMKTPQTLDSPKLPRRAKTPRTPAKHKKRKKKKVHKKSSSNKFASGSHRTHLPTSPSSPDFGLQIDSHQSDTNPNPLISGSPGFPPLPALPLEKEKSVRSFGELFSKQFQIDVANDYKKSLEIKRFMPIKVKSGFDDIKMDYLTDNNISDSTTKQQKIVQFFHDNYHGRNEVFESPFGLRPVIFADWNASGRSLECVETYLKKEVYTLYANIYCTTSITGTQTSKFRTESRSIILESLKGDYEEDVILFTGNDNTGAINHMSRILMNCKSYKPENTVVFISIYEQESNVFIWKELGCKLVIIPETMDNSKKGGISLNFLEKQLKFYTSQHMKYKYNLLIGSFSAASCMSGIIAPIDETTLLLHKYDALSFWDYSTAAPYLDINMTNTNNPMLSKDAVFISTHKFLAGPGAPGILCAKKHLFENYVPVIPGDGTLFTALGLNDGEWEYLDNIEEREEAGTQDIIGSVRAAFSFMIKDHLSTDFIIKTQNKYLQYFLQETKSLNNLVIIGNTKCNRLPIISFLVTYSQNKYGLSKTKYLHYNFISALFNDLFGIQGRGGYGCSAMYILKVLNIENNELHHVLKQMRDNKNELARPGSFTINLHYTLNENELEYIVNAVKYIAINGWKLLPLYDVDVETGNYFHRDIVKKSCVFKKQLRSLLDISFDEKDGKMLWKEKHLRVETKTLNDNFDKFFVLADDILNNLKQYLPTENEFKSEHKINDENAWYWLPSELYQDTKNSIKKFVD